MVIPNYLYSPWPTPHPPPHTHTHTTTPLLPRPPPSNPNLIGFSFTGFNHSSYYLQANGMESYPSLTCGQIWLNGFLIRLGGGVGWGWRPPIRTRYLVWLKIRLTSRNREGLSKWGGGWAEFNSERCNGVPTLCIEHTLSFQNRLWSFKWMLPR